MGASISFQRNLETEDRRIEPVRGAELSATAFAIMGTRALRGRTFTARDEQPGETPVVVIGHSLWSSRFDSDSQVVGRTITLGSTSATIVGVMPQGFGFPVNERIWTPLRLDGSLLALRSGPTSSVRC